MNSLPSPYKLEFTLEFYPLGMAKSAQFGLMTSQESLGVRGEMP
jgi:hypothetical protein